MNRRSFFGVIAALPATVAGKPSTSPALDLFLGITLEDQIRVQEAFNQLENEVRRRAATDRQAVADSITYQLDLSGEVAA